MGIDQRLEGQGREGQGLEGQGLEGEAGARGLGGSVYGAVDVFDDEGAQQIERVFDARILHEPLAAVHTRPPLIYSPTDTVSEAMREMQRKHRGCVLVTRDGGNRSPLVGIFTERDVLIRIIDRGRNPASLPLGEVMVADPECLPKQAPVAWALNKMAVGGFRHVPVVDDAGCPVLVVSVRDVVQFLVDAFPNEILNLPPEYGTDRYRTREGA